MYEVVFTKKACKFIISVQKAYKEKIRAVVEHLRENPFSYPYKKIRRETNLYRIRVGKYRILYEVDDIGRRITILKVGERESIYNR